VTCYLLTRRIICGLRIVYLDLLDITSGGVYNHLKRFQLHHTNQQLLLVLHLPQAGANHSWRTAVSNCSWWVHIPDCFNNQSFPAFITLGINCWSVRCLDTCMLTDRYEVATIPPLFRLPGYLAYRTVGSNLVVSVAWQWLFSTLDNSAFQTTCHNTIQHIHSLQISLSR
jgi:hypothetical protein